MMLRLPVTIHDNVIRDAQQHVVGMLLYTGDEDGVANRLNTHDELVEVLREAERMVDATCRNNPMPDDLAALTRIRNALAKVLP